MYRDARAFVTFARTYVVYVCDVVLWTLLSSILVRVICSRACHVTLARVFLRSYMEVGYSLYIIYSCYNNNYTCDRKGYYHDQSLHIDSHQRQLIFKQYQRLKARIAQVTEDVHVEVLCRPEAHYGHKPRQSPAIICSQIISGLLYVHTYTILIFCMDVCMHACFRSNSWKQQPRIHVEWDGIHWWSAGAYTYSTSSAAYKTPRQSGILKLLSQQTLRDYTRQIEAVFSAATDNMPITVAQIDTCPDRGKCVFLILDEMHIREDLVHNKHSGEFIGFTYLGNINSHLDAFKHAISRSEETKPSLAKTIMVFMV